MKEVSLFDRIMLVSDLVSQWLPVHVCMLTGQVVAFT